MPSGDRQPNGHVRSDAVWREAVAFLRDWLPESAKLIYREMIREDPEHWRMHPHFRGGIIADHALRGNGIDEKVLGVRDLEAVWPSLLLAALEPNGEHQE